MNTRVIDEANALCAEARPAKAQPCCTNCGRSFPAEKLSNPYDNPYGIGPTDERWCDDCITSAGEAQDRARDEDFYGA